MKFKQKKKITRGKKLSATYVFYSVHIAKRSFWKRNCFKRQKWDVPFSPKPTPTPLMMRFVSSFI